MKSACAILHCHLWPVWLYYIIPHYTINGIISMGKNTYHKMCFDFLYNFYLNRFSLCEEFSEVLWYHIIYMYCISYHIIYCISYHISYTCTVYIISYTCTVYHITSYTCTVYHIISYTCTCTVHVHRSSCQVPVILATF
jgi:hypothetical protein